MENDEWIPVMTPLSPAPKGTMLDESLSVPQSRATMHEPLSSCSDDDDNECENQQSKCDGDDSDIEDEEFMMMMHYSR